ncbi:MAG: TetR/AcrR family transcriptional regulator [Nocardioides sp.]
MSLKSGLGLDPRATRTRAAMVEAARVLLVTEGWDSITHAKVSAAAGVGRATAYRHWPTTTELAVEAATLEAESSQFPPTGDLRTDVVAALREFRFALTERGLKPLLLLITERATYDEEFRSVREQLHQRGVGPIRTVLGEAIRRGDLREGVEIDELLSLLAGPLIYEIVMHDRSFSDDRIAALADLVLYAHSGRDRS